MRRFMTIAAALSLLAGCGGRATTEAADSQQPASAEPDTVVISADSPMLKQIRREPVGTKELPTDEVIAPGKIEANPNRVSKVVLPGLMTPGLLESLLSANGTRRPSKSQTPRIVQ